MIVASHQQPPTSQSLIEYLQQRHGLSDKAIDLGLKQADIEQAPLPIILWSFGLISLSQYQQIFYYQIQLRIE